jgi:uncharacterized protein GlcG (DUF336 family)
MTLTLAKANTIIEAAFAKAAEQKFRPLAVVVLDQGGHVIAFQRQDGASMLRFEVAQGKAYGALGLGQSSRRLEKIAMDRPHFFSGYAGVTGGKAIPVAGGVLVRDSAAGLLGAVGVSGDTSDNDEAAAIAGIEVADLVADV